MADNPSSSSAAMSVSEGPSEIDVSSQPRLPRDEPESFSQPLLTVATKLSSKAKRRWTHQDKIPSGAGSESTMPISSLRKRIFDELCRRLDRKGIATSDLDARMFSFCLPSTAAVTAWNTVLEDPLLVSNNTLNTLIRLSNPDEPYRTDTTSIVYYIRTFAFSAAELLHVVQVLLEGGYGYLDKLYVWLERLRDMPSEEVIYLRYCGQTKHTAGLRHASDMSTKVGFISRFYQVLTDLYPEVIDNTLVQDVIGAAVDIPLHPRLLDLREQMIIALFEEGALNIDPGGKRQVFIREEDKQTFQLLNTNVTGLLRVATKPCSDEMHARIRQYVVDVEEYANSNPDTTGTNRHPFTQRMMDVYGDSAIPAVLHNGFVAMVTVGSDMPPAVFDNPEPKGFFLEKIQSANLAATTYNHLGAWETFSGRVEDTFTQSLVSGHHLPFVNLYPWTKKSDEDIQGASKLLRQYLQATGPLIVVTYSAPVSLLGLGSFKRSSWGGGDNDWTFLQKVGQLFIQSYDEEGQGQNDNWVILLPSNHPGMIAHTGSVREPANRLYTLTASIIWLAYNEALKLSVSQDSKLEICEKIKRKVELLTGPDTEFGKQFNAAKKEYREKLAAMYKSIRTPGITAAWKREANARQPILMSDISAGMSVSPSGVLSVAAEGGAGQKTVQIPERDYEALKAIKYTIWHGTAGIRMSEAFARWRVAKRELDMILLCGYAIGRPGSAERKTQASALWQSSIAQLEEPSKGSTENEFMAWAGTLAEGESYYFGATTAAEAPEEIPNLLCCWLYDYERDPEAPNATSNDQYMRQAIRGLRSWLSKWVQPRMRNEELIQNVEPYWYERMKGLDLDSWSRLPQKKQEIASKTFQANEDISGSQVQLIPHKTGYTGTSTIRYGLKWFDPAGKAFEVNDLLLPKGVMSKRAGDLRFIYFTPEGIDIRNSAGKALGTSQYRSVTLPLLDIINNLSGKPNKDRFLDLWERQTKTKVDDALNKANSPHQTADATEKIYPASFFEGRQIPLPAIAYSIRVNHLKELEASFPAKPGDELWLVDRFLTEMYPDGGILDCHNPAVAIHMREGGNETSVFAKLAEFCAKPKYRKHPYLLTLKLLADWAREGGNQIRRATSRLLLAVQALRGKDSVQEERLRIHYRISGHIQQSTRRVLTIGATRVQGVIEDLPSPELVPQEPQDEIDVEVLAAEEREDEAELHGTPPPQEAQVPAATTTTNDEMYRAWEPYPGETQSELNLEKDAIVIVKRKDRGGWWLVRRQDSSASGWVSSKFLEPYTPPPPGPAASPAPPAPPTGQVDPAASVSRSGPNTSAGTKRRAADEGGDNPSHKRSRQEEDDDEMLF